MKGQVMGIKCPVNVNEGANDKGPIRFHVMPEHSNSLINALGSVQTSQAVVRECMESFFKGAIEERLSMMGVDKIIKDQTDRRIEVAIKQVMTRVENELYAEAMKHARERLKELVYAAPLQIRIESNDEATA